MTGRDPVRSLALGRCGFQAIVAETESGTSNVLRKSAVPWGPIVASVGTVK
jgi:hypothetical protein